MSQGPKDRRVEIIARFTPSGATPTDDAPAGRAATREAGATITVRRRGEAHEVLFDGRVILASDASATEDAFGRMAADVVTGPTPRVLIGGLGFGYTVRGALAVLPRGARVVVAERVGRIVELCRGELRGLAGDPLSDPRVEVVQSSVQDFLKAGGPRFSAILLDVDNGPDWATFRENGWLYTDAGVRFLARALEPRGSLAVWSGYPAGKFLTVLRRCGLSAREVPFAVRGRVRARALVGQLRN